MLGEANTEKVLLEDEINYIKSYIALQNIRFSENDYVEFNIEGNIINKYIAPMILVPFIENAFKHGDKRQKAPGIKVSLIVSESEINFKVTNLKKKIKTVDIEEKSGFGLENLKRRLELTYPNKFELDIDDSGNEYITSLKIELSDED
jgi:LytS/YehU family sensor histidine kinase